MALDKYNTGLLSVANGSDAVTIDGALLQTWGAREDDILVIPGFVAVYIGEVTGQETLTLPYDWDGATQTDVAYTLMANPLTRLNAVGLSRMANSVRDLLAGIGGQPPMYRVLGSAPDDNIGEANQIAIKVDRVAHTIKFWAFEDGTYGDPLTLSPAYSDGFSFLDTNDNELLTFGVAASAVNNFKFANAAAGNAPKLSAIGGDSNISARYATKGTGSHIWEVNSIDELELSATYLRPHSDGGLSLGDATHGFDSASFSNGAIVRFNNAYTIIHSTGLLTANGAFAATALIPTSSTIPVNGLYLPAANTLGWAINSISELQLNATELFPASDLGQSLGTAAKRFDKLNNIDISSAANLFAAIKQTAAVAATGVVQLQVHVRERLTAYRTYYVRTDGNDANDGLTNASGGAWATWQKAINFVMDNLDLAGFNVTIQQGNSGTINGSISVIGRWTGKGTVMVLGDATTPSNCVLNNGSGSCVLVSNSGRLSVSGLKFTSGSHALYCETNGAITVAGKCDFGACTYEHMSINLQGQIVVNADYNITGGGRYHWGTFGGQIQCQGRTITLSGTPAFNTFAYADLGSQQLINGNTFSGSATGSRYNVVMNATVQTYGGGASYLPGNSAGVFSTGGQYA